MILNKKQTTTVTITEVSQAIEHIEKTGDSDFEYVWDISQKEAHLILAIIVEEMNGKKWIPIERIGEVIAELNVHIQEDAIDGAIKELLAKNLITESPKPIVPFLSLCSNVNHIFRLTTRLNYCIQILLKQKKINILIEISRPLL